MNRRGHGSFLVRQLPAHPAWQTQNLDETPHASSSILLKTDYETVPEVDNTNYFKMEGIQLVLENLDGKIVYVISLVLHSNLLPDYQRLFAETKSEWDDE